MFMLDLQDKGWRYWLASTTCLWLTLGGNAMAFGFALVIAGIQLLHFIIEERSLTAFSVQIRIGYLSVLLMCLPSVMEWLVWVPAIGTAARVLFGYCIMARMLMLLPVNRLEALTTRFVIRAFLTPPVRGNYLHGLPAGN